MTWRSAYVCGLALAAALLYIVQARTYDRGCPKVFQHADPGMFDCYALVLSWSPTHCLTQGRRRGDDQCDTNRGADFVLHGLWPQYNFGWPEGCYRGKRPWIPTDVIQKMEGIMPDKGVIIHEYRTHGTCSGLSPSAYFAAARKAYEKITIPSALDDPTTQRFLAPEKIEGEFLAANKWLRPDMIAVTCRHGNLFDVRSSVSPCRRLEAIDKRPA